MLFLLFSPLAYPFADPAAPISGARRLALALPLASPSPFTLVLAPAAGAARRLDSPPGPVCNGPCYAAWSTPWSTKCQVGYSHGCNDCPECQGATISTTSGSRGAIPAVCNGPCYAAWSTPWSRKCVPTYSHGCKDCPECQGDTPSTTSGRRGAICNGKCYSAHSTPWSTKCISGYTHGCEGCPECGWYPSTTSGGEGAIGSVCNGPCYAAHSTPWSTKCEVGYSHGCNACPECKLPPPLSPTPPPPHLPAIVPATVELHDLDPQWRFVHGYWQGTCVDIDEHGDGGAPYTRHVVASTSGSEYSEQSIKAGDSSWTTDIQGEVDYLQSSKTTVDFKSTTTNGVLSRTTAAGNDNSIHTFFYDEGGVLTHTRLISFRVTAGVMRRIVSTQSFTDGFAPSGLVECKDVKLASRAAADAALASDSLPGTSAPELFAAVATADFIHPYAQCNATAVVLADYPQYVQALQKP